MIYDILRPIVRFTLKLYFRRINIIGKENIPDNKPIIFVSNHPTAFLEPCVLACFLPKKLHFLVRGDLFSVSWLAWLLRGTNQIPIFRQRDGLENVKKNLETQSGLFSLFQANKALLMFPEAHTHENLFLRPLAKGLARFSFMEHGTDLHIVPVGVNFDQNVLFNSKANVVIGSAIRVKEFQENAYPTEAKRMKSFLDSVSQAMKSNLRHIENEEREEEILNVYKAMDMLDDNAVYPVLAEDEESFLQEKEIAMRIDQSSEAWENAKRFAYFKDLPRMNFGRKVSKIPWILFAPIFGVSLILHAIPVFIAQWIVKTRVKFHEFKSPVFVAMIVFVYLIISMVGIILAILVHPKIFIGLLLYLTIGLFGIVYLKNYYFYWNYMIQRKSTKEEISDILEGTKNLNLNAT